MGILSLKVLGVILGLTLMAIIWIVLRSVKKKMVPGTNHQPTVRSPKPNWEEKRRLERIDVAFPVTIMTSEGHIETTTKNLNIGGAFILCKKPLPLKQQFSLKLDAPDQQSETLKAEVLWSNCNVPEQEVVHRGMGVRFIQQTEKKRQFLAMAMSHPSVANATQHQPAF